MSKKHYVIWKGAKTGIFTSWLEVKANIDGRSDAQYMGFPSLLEAQQAFQSTYTKALTNRSLAKSSQNGAKKSETQSRSASSQSQSSQFQKKASIRTKSDNVTAMLTADINIYCDGACSPNPGKAGTGIAVYQKDQIKQLWYGLFDANGTNNTAELNGMLEAFILAEKFIKQNCRVQILSDSKYSIDCITKWAQGWKNKGWTRGKGEEIKNLSLIQQCFDSYEQMKSNLIVTHVKGHADIEGNELADRMAVLARSNQQTKFVQFSDVIDIATILAMQPD